MATQYEEAKRIADNEARQNGQDCATPENIARTFLAMRREYLPKPKAPRHANIAAPEEDIFIVVGQPRAQGGQPPVHKELVQGLRADIPHLTNRRLIDILAENDIYVDESQMSKYLKR